MLRNSPRRVEILEPRQILIVEIQHPRGGDEARFGLQQIGTGDREKRLAFLDVVTDFGEQRDDASLIRREYLYRHVLIEVDAADRLLLSREIPFRHRLNLDRAELGIRQIDALLRGRLVSAGA